MYTITQQTDNRIDLQVPKIGYVQLYRFGANHPSGRPWHIVTFGVFCATPDDCCTYLEKVVAGWDRDDAYEQERPVCHAEMTHSFRALEADLDNCPC